MTVMLVMGVREMGVGVHHRFMPVPVGVLGARRSRCVVPVLMVLIMDMFVAVLHRLVGVGVLMPFR